MVSVSMTVNGKTVSGKVEARTLLVQFLRENLRLTGTHVGCDTSQCGACVVHVDGKAVKSCTTLAVSCEGASVITIEGLAKGDRTAPDAGGFPRASRPAVRVLHAGHDHVGCRSGEPQGSRILTSRRSVRSWKAISAAARAITISSRRSMPVRRAMAIGHASKAAE